MEQAQLDRLSKLFKALADPARLRILGLIAEQAFTGQELADRLGLTPPTISHHMRKLVEAGLVDVTPEAQSRRYSLRAETLRDLSRTITKQETPRDAQTGDAAVLRAFFDGPRLKQIPASRKKRVVVLRRLFAQFSPDKTYPEADVNAILLRAHEDYATLRRELVDYGFMTRDKGIYRVATELPERGSTVLQEVGDETSWFPKLILDATTKAITDAITIELGRPPAPRE